jgi:hypothetical protein
MGEGVGVGVGVLSVLIGTSCWSYMTVLRTQKTQKLKGVYLGHS